MARIHFSGVGGTAMIGGAYIAKQMGHEIRGSDNPLYPPTSILAKKLGIPIYEQYSANNLEWNPDYVIIGNALSRGNEEVEAILSRRIPYTSLPEWLRHNVLFKRKPVVVAGTHGKTTTTSLIAWVLQYAGLEPGFLIGGYPLNFDFPSFLGKEDSYFVIEGDEYDTAFFDKRAKFLHYLPQVLVVTSLEYDHSDIYNNIQEIEKAFQLLLRIVPKEGMVFLCEDNHAKMLRDYSFSQCQTYGFSKEAIWRVERRMDTDLNKMELSIFYKGKKLCTIQPNLFGKHNTLNILGTVAVSHSLGVSLDMIKGGIESFAGVKRRQEVFLKVDKKVFVDDFAHHPTAIRETLSALKEKYPDKKLIAIFEPRSNTTVTNIFQKELSESLEMADEVWLTPIYREEKIPIEKRLDTEKLICSLHDKGKRAEAAYNFDEIFDYLCNKLDDNTVVALMSNGACGNLRERLLNYFSAD